MTRQEYMEQLKKYLKRLPKEDYENAIEYFSEYFDEAGLQKEQQVMKELGEPKEAARELLLNLLQESVENDQDIVEEKAAVQPEAASGGKKRSPGKIILLAILVLCASPVSLALLVGVLAVLLAVVITATAVIFSLGITSIAATAGGIVTVGFGATLVLKSAAAACMMIGGGFLMAGIGILAGVLTIYICKWCANGIGRLVNRFVRKKVRKDE
jgi:predicted membrane protein